VADEPIIEEVSVEESIGGVEESLRVRASIDGLVSRGE
jgi:hypothetical protein